MGKDQQAQEFLGKLDNDPVIGRMVDATSYYELEAMEYQKKGVVTASLLLLTRDAVLGTPSRKRSTSAAV